MGEGDLFWKDLDRNLKDPEFAREFVLQSLRIQTVDEIVNALDSAREAAGLSKADLARAINAEPAVVRRLFTAHGNPTIGRLTEIAAALGLRVALAPMPAAEAARVKQSLVERSASAPAFSLRRAQTQLRGTRQNRLPESQSKKGKTADTDREATTNGARTRVGRPARPTPSRRGDMASYAMDRGFFPKYSAPSALTAD